MAKKEEGKQEKSLRKKSYEKPRIVHQQSLEVMAGVCEIPLGKVDDTFCLGLNHLS